MAEIALGRALLAGLPESMQTDAWHAQLALNQRQFARALDFAWLAINAGSKDDLVYCAFVSAAAASFKLGALRDMYPKTPNWLPRTGIADKLASIYSHLPPEQNKFLSPLTESRALVKENLIQIFEPLPKNAANPTDADTVQFIQSLWLRSSVPFSARDDAIWTASIGPTTANLCFSAHFTIRPFSAGPIGFARNFRIEFVDPDSRQPDFMVGISQLDITSHSGNSELTSTIHQWQEFSDPNRVHTIEMALVNGRAECVVDGERIFYNAVPSKSATHGIQLITTGMDVDLRDIHIYRLTTAEAFNTDYKGKLDAILKDGRTPLQSAAADGLVKECELLLSMGADPNVKDAGGLTAVHMPHAARMSTCCVCC